MGIKKPIYKSGITYFLTQSKKSYAELAEDLTKKIDSDLEITVKRVKDLASGLSPHPIELEALCSINNVNNWRELYFPNNQFTLLFIYYFLFKEKEIASILKNEQINEFVKKRSLLSLYRGLMDKDVSIKTLESILITQIYFKLCSKDLISEPKSKEYNFEYYKKRIEYTLFEKLNRIDVNSILIQNLTINLRKTVVKSGSNHADTKRVALKEIIKVISQL